MRATHSTSATSAGKISALARTFPYFFWKGSIIVTYLFSLIGLAKKKPPAGGGKGFSKTSDYLLENVFKFRIHRLHISFINERERKRFSGRVKEWTLLNNRKKQVLPPDSIINTFRQTHEAIRPTMRHVVFPDKRLQFTLLSRSVGYCERGARVPMTKHVTNVYGCRMPCRVCQFGEFTRRQPKLRGKPICLHLLPPVKILNWFTTVLFLTRATLLLVQSNGVCGKGSYTDGSQ